jgi:hypothetical protein
LFTRAHAVVFCGLEAGFGKEEVCRPPQSKKQQQLEPQVRTLAGFF